MSNNNLSYQPNKTKHFFSSRETLTENLWSLRCSWERLLSNLTRAYDVMLTSSWVLVHVSDWLITSAKCEDASRRLTTIISWVRHEGSLETKCSLTVWSRTTYLISIGNNINSRALPVASPTISRPFQPMTSQADKLPLKTQPRSQALSSLPPLVDQWRQKRESLGTKLLEREPGTHDNNTIFTLKPFVAPYSM